MDQDRRVLLVHFDFEDDRLPTGLWACPGGGIDPGETVRDGLIRELREELGLTITDPGEPIWLKHQIFPMSRWDGQHDTYFFVEVDAFDPQPHFTEAELLAEHVDGLRWWGYDELLRAQQVYDRSDDTDPAWAVFSPRRFGHLVRALVEQGRPAHAIQVAAP
jgi:8-oxo-dGTP pyrophosphatase MutT (NUDIX family)